MTDPTPAAGRMARALANLGLIRRAGHIPFVQGLQTADCGAACLAMVLGYFGRHESLAGVHAALPVGRDGVTARAIADAARRYGLTTRVLSVPKGSWADLPRGAILHWRFNHFVVFDRLDRRGIIIFDPAVGRRRLTHEEFRVSFTGVALASTPGEGFETRRAERSHAWGLLAILLSEKRLLYRVIATSIVIQILGLGLPVLTGMVVDTVLPRADESLLAIIAIGIGLVVVAEGLADVVRSYLLANWKVIADARLTMRFFEHMLSLPYSFFQTHADGDLLMRLQSNATIREIMSGGVFSALLDGTTVSIYLVVLFALKPLVGVLVLLATALLAAPFFLTKIYRQELAARYLDARSKSESLEVEVLRAVETIKAMGLEPDLLERWSNLAVNTLNIDLERDRVAALVRMCEEVVRIATPLVVLLVGTRMVLQGELHTGEMLALSTLAGLFVSRVVGFSEKARSLQILGSYVERIAEVMDAEVEARGARAVPLEVRGEVVGRNLFFRYDALAPWAVEDISLEVRAGSAVAFVGASGSGKSTLVRMIAGLYAPTTGELQLDGVPLSELDLHHYRRRISVVTQDTHLFAGSVRQNIALSAPTAGMSEVIAAAKQACIHDEIMAMPMGYETVLTDQGRSLSGGQRQRLALARALLRRPRLLLLDEATSAIDAVTEDAIKRNLDGIQATRLIVAHRLSTIRDVDEIFVIENRRVAEHGTHDELVAAGGAYARLVATQTTERKS